MDRWWVCTEGMVGDVGLLELLVGWMPVGDCTGYDLVQHHAICGARGADQFLCLGDHLEGLACFCGSYSRIE